MRDGDFRFDLREASGAFGDLGTLLPLVLGALAVGRLAAASVLAAFGFAYCTTALIYRLPVPVQPMKAIVAVLLVAKVAPPTLAASAVILGLVLMVLGVTGLITASAGSCRNLYLRASSSASGSRSRSWHWI